MKAVFFQKTHSYCNNKQAYLLAHPVYNVVIGSSATRYILL